MLFWYTSRQEKGLSSDKTQIPWGAFSIHSHSDDSAFVCDGASICSYGIIAGVCND